MNKLFTTWMMATALTLVGCNESRRGNDTNLNETRNEAAEESNTDKFSGSVKRDANFVYDVVASQYAEIKLSELASQRSRNPEIKRIAQDLLKDHTASLNELKTLAQSKAISVPVQEEDGSKRTLERMAGEPADEFDDAWAEHMADMHQKDIDAFEDRLEGTEDPELKAYIERNLPVLKKHHEALSRYTEQKKAQAGR